MVFSILGHNWDVHFLWRESECLQSCLVHFEFKWLQGIHFFSFELILFADMLSKHLLVVLLLDPRHLVLLLHDGLGDAEVEGRPVAVFFYVFLGVVNAFLRALVDQHVVNFGCGLPSLVALRSLYLIVYVLLGYQFDCLRFEVLFLQLFFNRFLLR